MILLLMYSDNWFHPYGHIHYVDTPHKLNDKSLNF